MSLPTVPPIRLSDLQTYFTAPGSTGLLDFYAGGTYVPVGTRNGLGNLIPSSGNISLLDFLGAVKPLQSLMLTIGTDGVGDYGLLDTLSYGSIAPSDFFIHIGPANHINACIWSDAPYFAFGTNQDVGNAGWTTLYANGTPFTLASAAYSGGPSGSIWRWDGVGNPIGTSGVVPIIFY